MRGLPEVMMLSIIQGKHFVSVDEGDIVSVIDRLEKGRMEDLEAIAKNAQDFATRSGF